MIIKKWIFFHSGAGDFTHKHGDDKDKYIELSVSKMIRFGDINIVLSKNYQPKNTSTHKQFFQIVELLVNNKEI